MIELDVSRGNFGCDLFYSSCKPGEQDKLYQKLFVIQNVYTNL